MLMLRKPAAREKSAVHPARSLKFAVVEGLNAQADTVEAGRAPCGRFYGRNRFGVGLERDFEKVGAIALPQRIENLRQSGRLQKARRAAAEIDRVDDIRSGGRDGFRNLAANGIGVGLIAVAGHHAGVEIAVGAFRLAERHLDVNAESHELSKESSTARAALRSRRIPNPRAPI
jgi:hypothetical protein